MTITRGRGTNVTTVSSAEHTRRDFLYIATGAVATVGAAAVLVPLINQMNPDASTIAAGAPIEVDLAPVAAGQIIKVFLPVPRLSIRQRRPHPAGPRAEEFAAPALCFRFRQQDPDRLIRPSAQ
jgi:Rieske Fe-S protein